MELLQSTVQRVLAAWPALKMAVEQGFGGESSREKGEWLAGAMAQVLVDNRDLDVDEVESYLVDIMYEEFHAVVDDGSLQQVSRQLHTVYQLWCNQSSLELVQWLQDNCQPLGVVGQEVAQEESMDDITQGEEKQYDRITEMEGEPSRQQENGIISSCSVAESRDEMHMDVEDGGEEWQVVKRTRRK